MPTLCNHVTVLWFSSNIQPCCDFHQTLLTFLELFKTPFSIILCMVVLLYFLNHFRTIECFCFQDFCLTHLYTGLQIILFIILFRHSYTQYIKSYWEKNMQPYFLCEQMNKLCIAWSPQKPFKLLKAKTICFNRI